MHHSVMGFIPTKGEEIDHIDPLRTLENIPTNLRHATHSQQGMNRRRRSDNTTGYKGVGFDKNRKARPYRAMICCDGEVRRLGWFATPEEAHHVYVEAAKRLHGEFMRAG